MADYFDSAPNFTNPAYATPEQLATARAYATELTKRSGENVNRPTGALANMITALTAGLTRNNADTMQSQAAAGNQQQLQAIIEQLKNGSPQGAAPQSAPQAAPVAAAPSAPPMVPPTPEGVTRLDPQATANWRADTPLPNPAAGAAAASSPPAAGVQAQGPGLPPGQAPAPNFDQRFSGLDPKALAYVLANPMSSPEQRAIVQHLIQPQGGKDVYNQPYYTSPLAPAAGQPHFGITAPVQAGSVGTTQIITPPGANPAQPNSAVPGFNGGNGIDALAAKDRELSAAKEVTQAGAGAQGGVNQEDIRNAAAAPAVLKDIGAIKGIVQSMPGVTFGPTAQISAEAKRVIANYAPGLVDEKSLAGTDAIEKLNFGLATQLAKTVGATQGEVFKAMGSVPGTEKSKQGTLALIDMMQQKAMKDQQLGALYRQYEQGNNLGAYPAAREKFLTDHPTINPITGKPVEMDIAAVRSGQGGGYEKTATNPTTGAKMGLRDGKWEPIK